MFGQGVAGYYDPRTKRLRIVSGAQTTNRFLNEITLAHELTHALEDQRFKLDLESSSSDDAASPTSRWSRARPPRSCSPTPSATSRPSRRSAACSRASAQDTGDLPPFVEAQLVFPYMQGQRFIQRLTDRRRQLVVVDAAYRFRPPASTEQIMHPDKYLQVEQPDRVPLDARRPARAGGAGAAAPGASGRPAS